MAAIRRSKEKKPVAEATVLRCSFCAKTQNEVKKLICGPEPSKICNECIEICNEIMEEDRIKPIVKKILADLKDELAAGG